MHDFHGKLKTPLSFSAILRIPAVSAGKDPGSGHSLGLQEVWNFNPLLGYETVDGNP